MNIQGINIHEHEFCPKDSKCLLNIYSVFMNIHSSGGGGDKGDAEFWLIHAIFQKHYINIGCHIRDHHLHKGIVF